MMSVSDPSYPSDMSYSADASTQKAVGDQGDAMTLGYRAAAVRIEWEVGVPSGAVLDLGCNTGAGIQELERRWPEAIVIGIEPVEDFAAKARARNLDVWTGQAEKMPFPDESIDFVFARHSLEHVADRKQAIAEIARILRPGGQLYVQAPIEPNGTKNRAHLSPFTSLEGLRSAFPGFQELYWGPQETVGELILEKF